jgi:hypothetical protein
MASGSIGPLARGIRSPQVDAVLGFDNLKNFEYIQFVLPYNTIRFSSSTPYKPHENLLMTKAKIIKKPGYGLAIEGFVDGQRTPILLDLAGNYSFARGDVKVKTTREVDLATLSFNQVPTLVLPIHDAPPRVGRKLLASYIITICNREGVVYFERPPVQ